MTRKAKVNENIYFGICPTCPLLFIYSHRLHNKIFLTNKKTPQNIPETYSYIH